MAGMIYTPAGLIYAVNGDLSLTGLLTKCESSANRNV